MDPTDIEIEPDVDLSADAAPAAHRPARPARPAKLGRARVSKAASPAAKPVGATPAGSSDADSAPRWLNDEQQRDWRAFYYAIVRLQEALDRDLLNGYGFPHGYYEIFVRLSEAPDRSMRMSELAAATRSSRSRLSHAVARLEEAGWVLRESCLTDRRGQIAHLTDSGLDLLTRAAPSHLESVRAYLVDPLTDAQLRQLGDIGRIVFDSIPD